ncbi:Integral membrane protein CcmA involved in cell shape determination [Clostridium putrefaciens]|uniref:Integral membrane protein CcmA involved in cell shape determination n=1 Tax=Clostridium putrefaciens TaxID=99675 RepID=A0A381JA08_9CLOT|nr:polymer-forming cytoskeletal protein [Clostridium putrefaciens]SUY47843.1 Integral membrane protein CcmA involved in cell shape determination [Clostridium putrefaciens]
MFSDKDGKNLDRIETLIGELCSIVGNISGEGLIKIDGSIDGDIKWKDDIIIGETALYNGNISCKNAKVNGRVKGNITCEDNLIIEPLGNISGDITVKHVTIKEGASLDGRCTMLINKIQD